MSSDTKMVSGLIMKYNLALKLILGIMLLCFLYSVLHLKKRIKLYIKHVFIKQKIYEASAIVSVTLHYTQGSRQSIHFSISFS